MNEQGNVEQASSSRTDIQETGTYGSEANLQESASSTKVIWNGYPKSHFKESHVWLHHFLFKKKNWFWMEWQPSNQAKWAGKFDSRLPKIVKKQIMWSCMCTIRLWRWLCESYSYLEILLLEQEFDRKKSVLLLTRNWALWGNYFQTKRATH